MEPVWRFRAATSIFHRLFKWISLRMTAGLVFSLLPPELGPSRNRAVDWFLSNGPSGTNQLNVLEVLKDPKTSMSVTEQGFVTPW